MKMERTDRLRRRPSFIRYYYLVISENDIHTGASYGGLEYVRKNHTIKSLFLSDLVTKRVITINESIEDFMLKWRTHYNSPDWDYEAEMTTDCDSLIIPIL